MKQIIIAVVVLLLTSSCSTYKKYSRPEEVSTNNLFGEDVAVTDTFTAASIPWHEFFTDSKLRTLIDTALANNSDLRIASLRVEQAEATLSAARLAYLPGISLNPTGRHKQLRRR